MSGPWFGLYLPQIRMSFDRILERTLAAEAAGFDSVWLMDHLTAPAAPEVDTLEGWTVASALAARTSRIRIGHLVLCDAFRHAALLAKMAATLDVISGGRLDLGIGWGSVPAELETYGFGPEPPAVRAGKLRETLEILELMFGGEPFDYDGRYHQLHRAIGRPVPVQARVPVHIGGGGPKLTMPLVERFADWWNCPGYALDRLDELRPLAGRARVSTQHPIGLAADPVSRDETIATVHRRFGTWGGVIAGTSSEVADALAAEAGRGVEGFVLQFSDFGTPETVERFMTDVAPVVRDSREPPMDTPMAAETVTIAGHNGDEIEAYFARPTSPGPHPGVVVIHHMPGYDRSTKEIVRTFAAYGYAALCPNLFHRYAPGAKSTDGAAAAIEAGGAPDDQCVGDVRGAAEYLRALPASNGRVGVIGYCSGGRHAYVVACRLELDAAVDCYGGRVVATPEELTPARPVAAIDLTPNLGCPLLGLFGGQDSNPSPEQTAQIEEALRAHGKEYEFHTFDDAGHAFFSVDRPNYNLDASREGWKLIWDFFGRHLAV